MRINMTVDVIIPTYKPDENFIKLLDKLNKQTVKPAHIIVMNTEESYLDNLFLGKRYDPSEDNVEIHHLSKREFDHGATRNAGVRHSNAEYFIMMTQDAMPADDVMIEELLKPFEDKEVAVSYARQLAREGAGSIERMTRAFNYPAKSRIKTKADKEKLQIKTYFASNVCCAYRRETFDELKGFVHPAIFNEDMIYAARVIEAGLKVAYRAEAQVIHSHDYSAAQQFRRNFDNGVSHRQYAHVFKDVRAEGEGKRLVMSVIKRLHKRKEDYLIPGYIWESGCKYLGYKLGEHYDRLPAGLVMKCTSNKAFFEKRLS